MKNIKKLTSIVMVASVTMALFSGCGSKTSGTTTTAPPASTASTTSTADTKSTKVDASATTDNKKPDQTAMKTIYSTVLKGLVTDKTITQAQSDKVLEVVSKEPTDGGKTGGAAPAGDAAANGTKPSGTPPTDGTKPSGTPPTGTAPKDDRLSELVTSKVITQSQADTINTKVAEAMKNTQTK